MKDLRLDTVTHDLKIVNNDLSFVNDLEAICQQLKIRLQFYAGEWFLDTTLGVPFITQVNRKIPNLPLITTLIRDVITKTDGVLSIVKFNMVFDRSIRRLSIDFQCNTVFGITPTISEII